MSKISINFIIYILQYNYIFHNIYITLFNFPDTFWIFTILKLMSLKTYSFCFHPTHIKLFSKANVLYTIIFTERSGNMTRHLILFTNSLKYYALQRKLKFEIENYATVRFHNWILKFSLTFLYKFPNWNLQFRY